MKDFTEEQLGYRYCVTVSFLAKKKEPKQQLLKKPETWFVLVSWYGILGHLLLLPMSFIFPKILHIIIAGQCLLSFLFNTFFLPEGIVLTSLHLDGHIICVSFDPAFMMPFPFTIILFPINSPAIASVFHLLIFRDIGKVLIVWVATSKISFNSILTFFLLLYCWGIFNPFFSFLKVYIMPDISNSYSNLSFLILQVLVWFLKILWQIPIAYLV